MDPLETVQPAPPSPPSPDGVIDTPELSQDQMRKNLQDMMAKIDTKYQDFNTQKFTTTNSVQSQQSELLRQFFDMLQSMGIDPSNPEEVRSFLDKIKEQNPELSQQIEQALQILLGDDSLNPEKNIPENMNINQDENIQQNT